MKKNLTSKTCACFLDPAAAFVNADYKPFNYPSKCYLIRRKKEIFTLSERTRFEFDVSGRRHTLFQTIVSVCIKCIKFQINLLSVVDKFQDLKCLYTEQDKFGGTLPNDFDEIAGESGSECEESVVTISEDTKTSCFTHSKLNFYLYCTNCQREF